MSSENQGLEEYLKKLHESKALDYFHPKNCQLDGMNIQMEPDKIMYSPLVSGEFALASAIYCQASNACNGITGGRPNREATMHEDTKATTILRLLKNYQNSAKSRASSTPDSDAQSQMLRTLHTIKSNLSPTLQAAFDAYMSAGKQHGQQSRLGVELTGQGKDRTGYGRE